MANTQSLESGHTQPDAGRAPELAQATGYRRLRMGREYKLRRKCPYCGGNLTMSVNECEEHETGWVATGLDIDCDTEPDIDGPEWEGWWDNHSHDYCHAWQDLHAVLVANLKFTHRVEQR